MALVFPEPKMAQQAKPKQNLVRHESEADEPA